MIDGRELFLGELAELDPAHAGHERRAETGAAGPKYRLEEENGRG